MNTDELYAQYLLWRKGLVLKLALFHFTLILLFDFLAIYAPTTMSINLWSGLPFNIGVVFAIGIVFSVIGCSFYYSYRINQEESKIKRASGMTGS